MRNPLDVAQQIISVVPDEIQPPFEKLVYDFSYKAPEQQGECWGKLAALCNRLWAAVFPLSMIGN